MGELPPPDNDEENRIDNARNALLAHYSAKSTAQTAVLVGLAVALFADIQAVDVLDKTLHVPLGWILGFLTFSIGAIIFFILHAIGRLVFYGEQATQVANADLLPTDLDHHTYLSRLGGFSLARASDRIKEKKSASSLICRVTFNEYFKVFYLLLLIIVFLLQLLFLNAHFVF